MGFGTVDCYTVEPPPADQPFLGWKIRPHLTHGAGGNSVKDGLTEAQARAFIDEWKLTVCK